MLLVAARLGEQLLYGLQRIGGLLPDTRIRVLCGLTGQIDGVPMDHDLAHAPVSVQSLDCHACWPPCCCRNGKWPDPRCGSGALSLPGDRPAGDRSPRPWSSPG